jgi:diguanylate cyclase (GGDEF)-like protein
VLPRQTRKFKPFPEWERFFLFIQKKTGGHRKEFFQYNRVSRDVTSSRREKDFSVYLEKFDGGQLDCRVFLFGLRYPIFKQMKGFMGLYLLGKQDVSLDVAGLLVQGGGLEIINFIYSESLAGRALKYESLAIRFQDKIPTFKRLIEYKLCLKRHVNSGQTEVILSFIGFLCSDGFDASKAILDKMYSEIKKVYEETDGEGQITSQGLKEIAFGEGDPNAEKTVVFLMDLFQTSPVSIFHFPQRILNSLIVKATVDILEYKFFANYISKCIEIFNKDLQDQINPFAGVFDDTPPIPQKAEKIPETDGLDDKLPILKSSFIKNNLPTIIESNVNNKLPVSLVIADIDFFKNFNTKYGPLIGDDVLKVTAIKIKNVVGEKGKVVRFGGEEIHVILPNYTIEEAGCLAERLRQEIDKYPFKVKKDGQEEIAKITISLGVTVTYKIINWETLVEEADKALRISKAKGRNQVNIFNAQQASFSEEEIIIQSIEKKEAKDKALSALRLLNEGNSEEYAKNLKLAFDIILREWKAAYSRKNKIDMSNMNVDELVRNNILNVNLIEFKRFEHALPHISWFANGDYQVRIKVAKDVKDKFYLNFFIDFIIKLQNLAKF